MNPQYCTVGKIVRPHGVRGEVKVIPMTDFPERFGTRRELFIEPPDEPTPMIVESVRPHKRAFLIKFKGVDTISDAEMLVDRFVRVPESSLPALEDGAYYWHQLEGLSVIDDSEGDIGRVDHIFRAGKLGNDVLVVIGDAGERLVPMIDDVIVEVDLDEGVIRVRLLEGM